VSDRDDEAVRIAEAILDPVLERAIAVAIAASPVGQDEKLGGVRIAKLALLAPPACEVVGGELGCVVRGSHVESPSVGEDVVEAVGDRKAMRVGAEVVVVDQGGGTCQPP